MLTGVCCTLIHALHTHLKGMLPSSAARPRAEMGRNTPTFQAAKIIGRSQSNSDQEHQAVDHIYMLSGAGGTILHSSIPSPGLSGVASHTGCNTS